MINVPKLIPVHSHRYISSDPNEAGNPIFSVYQMDIIFCESNIWEYLYVEFKEKQHKGIDFDHIRYIPFWYDIVCNIENLVEKEIKKRRLSMGTKFANIQVQGLSVLEAQKLLPNEYSGSV